MDGTSIEIGQLIIINSTNSKITNFNFHQLYVGLYINHGASLNISHNNFSENNTISVNDEILALNDQPISKFMTDMYKNISGPSDYFKESHIEQRVFARIYWYFYGECKALKLQIKKKNGEESELVLNAIPGNEIEEKNRQQKSNMRH